jgi:hypothetical protein
VVYQDVVLAERTRLIGFTNKKKVREFDPHSAVDLGEPLARGRASSLVHSGLMKPEIMAANHQESSMICAVWLNPIRARSTDRVVWGV